MLMTITNHMEKRVTAFLLFWRTIKFLYINRGYREGYAKKTVADVVSQFISNNATNRMPCGT